MGSLGKRGKGKNGEKRKGGNGREKGMGSLRICEKREREENGAVSYGKKEWLAWKGEQKRGKERREWEEIEQRDR